MQASKSDRKLYVGNLPPNLTPQTVKIYLSSKNIFKTQLNPKFHNEIK